MRLLIYAMQSSGASTLAFLLAQRPACGAFADIWAMYAAPSLQGTNDVVAKVVVTTAFPLALHQERFRPDVTILLLRHPVANYRSLMSKPYRHHCGFMEEKFALLDQVFGAWSSYDAIVYYEDLLFDPVGTLNRMAELGWPCDAGYLKFPRKHPDIVAFNEQNFPELVDRLQYGRGNSRGLRIRPEFAGLDNLADDRPVVDWSPRVLGHYRDLIAENRRRWTATQSGREVEPVASGVNP